MFSSTVLLMRNTNLFMYALIFTIYDCGFIPRCALELNDSGVVRYEKIKTLIADCKFGIHDISRTDLDPRTRLPRFNMPYELGIFIGARDFGQGKHRTKNCLILDKTRYRYQKFISDIAGQDIQSHKNDIAKIITCTRDWLRSSSKRKTIPGGQEITRRYNVFKKDLPKICKKTRIIMPELTFNDYSQFVFEWLSSQQKTDPLNSVP